MIVHVPAADTVQQCHAAWNPGEFAVFVADHNPAPGGPGGVGQTLKLQTGEHVGIFSVTVLFHTCGIKNIVAGGQYDAADFNFDVLGLHVMVNGLGLADLYALHAFTANAAVQTTIDLPMSGGLIKTTINLVKGLCPGRRFEAAGLNPGPGGQFRGDLSPVPSRRILILRPAGQDIEIFTVKISTDRLNRPVTGGHGLDHRSRTGNHVSSGKYIRDRRLHGPGIND